MDTQELVADTCCAIGSKSMVGEGIDLPKRNTCFPGEEITTQKKQNDEFIFEGRKPAYIAFIRLYPSNTVMGWPCF